MSTPTVDDKKEVQLKIDQIAEMLKTDPSAQAEAKKDPMAFLTSKGLPDQAAREVLTKVAQASGATDVSGYNFWVDTDVYLDGSYAFTDRDWYDDWGNFLYEEIVVKY